MPRFNVVESTFLGLQKALSSAEIPLRSCSVSQVKKIVLTDQTLEWYPSAAEVLLSFRVYLYRRDVLSLAKYQVNPLFPSKILVSPGGASQARTVRRSVKDLGMRGISHRDTL